MPDKRDPNQEKQNRKNQKQTIAGNVGIRDQVLIEFGPKEIKTRTTRDQKEKARHHLTRILEVTTLIVLIIYASLTAWQACSASRSANLAQTAIGQAARQFQDEQRPYLSIATNQNLIHTIMPSPKGPFIVGGIPMTNFGKSPAMHVLAEAEILTSSGAQNSDEAWETLKAKSDEWFAHTEMPLKRTIRPSDGLYTLRNGLGVSEKTVMQGNPLVISAFQVSNFGIAQLPAMIVARVEYKSGRGDLYWTDICYIIPQQIGPDGTKAPDPYACPTHNELH